MAVRTQAGSLINGQASPYIVVQILQIILMSFNPFRGEEQITEATEFSVEPVEAPPSFAKTREF